MGSEGTVLVTGVAGFIGRWVAAELLDRGYTVRGVDNLATGSRGNVSEFADHRRFSLERADVRDASAVEAVFDDDVDACVHLAAEIDVQESLDDPRTHFETNVVGTERVLEACRRTDARLALVGTCMVYDAAESNGAIDETHPVEPTSPYAGSKLAAENLAMSYNRGYDLPVTVLRPFNTYGPYQRDGTAGGVVSVFTARDLQGEPLRIFGDGTQTRDLLYVTDCARFIVDAALSAAAVGEVFNAGTGRDVSINDLAAAIATEGTAVEHVEHHHPQSEIQKLRCDPSKARRVLGWEPEVPLDEGLGRLRVWLRSRVDD